MKFIFKAKNKKGEYTSGEIDASTEEAAVVVLQRNGLFPISVEKQERNNDDLLKLILKYYDQVTEKELMMFFRQMSVLIKGKVPLVVSLTAMKEQTSNKYFSHIIQELIGDIEDGMSFSSALEKHSDVFSKFAVNMVRAGEASGNLQRSVSYIAENIDRNYKLSSRIKSAMIYPALVMVVFFIMGFLSITFIIPKLTAIIKELDAVVPWYTQVVISISDFMVTYWWAALIIVFGVIAGIIYYLKNEDGRKEWDWVKLKLPVVGTLYRFIYISRFSENLSSLLSGGIPIIHALTIVSDVIGNSVYQDIFQKAAEEVRRGGNMSGVFRKSELIPPIVSQMIKIGEDSGQVDFVLKNIAEFYDQETETMTKALTSILEPVIMVIIGAAVGFMAFAILMPIYNIAGQIK